ncbi:MAG: hypothetical protein GOV15_04765, partial [Candidatus Diapherotrites archaeon]|nr:hypothetical protein [Candidatus Diapherotrites archaeon]
MTEHKVEHKHEAHPEHKAEHKHSHEHKAEHKPEHKHKKKSFKLSKPLMYLLGVFVLSYVLVYFAFSLMGYSYESPTFWILPIPAFFLAFYTPDFFDESGKSFMHKWTMVPVFVVLALLAWWLAVTIYFWNIFTLQGSVAWNFPSPWDLIGSSSYLSFVVFGTIALIYR